MKKQVRFDSPNALANLAHEDLVHNQSEAVIEVHAHGHEEVIPNSDRKSSPAAPA